MANTVLLKAYSDNFETSLEATETISPGSLVENASATTVQNHGTAGGDASPMFAYEDELQGNDINDDYSSGDVVLIYHAIPGDRLNVLFTASENIAIGDFLESAGDGTLQEVTTGKAIAVAREAINPAVAGTLYEVEII